jgi:hypothetical protein
VIVQASQPKGLEWICERTGLVPTADTRAIEAVDSTGAVRGMVAYEGWTQNSVRVHVAVDTPLAFRHMLRPAFEYPFVAAGRGILIGIIPASNARSVRFNRHVGFVETHRIRDGLRAGVDLILFEMRREQCRWLTENKKAA